MSQQNQNKVKCTGCFKSLGVGSRMSIYNFLDKRGESSVSKVVTYVGLKQPTVSYHLKEMRENGLLYNKRFGKEVVYGVNKVCPHYENACVMESVKFPTDAV